MRRRPALTGWRLYLTVFLLGYLLVFAVIWMKRTLQARTNRFDVSLGEAAILSGVAAACITASVAFTDVRKNR